VRLYALIDASLPEPVDVYGCRKAAEQALAVLLADEPSWRSLLSIEPFDLPDPGIAS
jgi:hypothetical protein